MTDKQDKRPWVVKIKARVKQLELENQQLAEDKELLRSSVSRHAGDLSAERKANKLLKEEKDAATAELERVKADLAKVRTDLKAAQKRWWHGFIPA